MTRQTHQIMSVTTLQWCYIQSAPVSVSSEPFHGRARESIPSVSRGSNNGGKEAETRRQQRPNV